MCGPSVGTRSGPSSSQSGVRDRKKTLDRFSHAISETEGIPSWMGDSARRDRRAQLSDERSSQRKSGRPGTRAGASLSLQERHGIYRAWIRKVLQNSRASGRVWGSLRQLGPDRVAHARTEGASFAVSWHAVRPGDTRGKERSRRARTQPWSAGRLAEEMQ